MANDYWNSSIQYLDDYFTGLYYSGMYYYILDDGNSSATSVLGNCNAVHSLIWSPILDKTMVSTTPVTYDVERFGKLQGVSLSNAPTLERIVSVDKPTILLKKVKQYKFEKPTHNYRDYRNESRLLNFPYSYGYICDFINKPIEIQYHLCPRMSDGMISIKAKAVVSDRGEYSIYVENYKGDYYGNMECSVNGGSLDLPVSSSAYSQFSSTQKAQYNKNLEYTLTNTNLNTGQSVISSLQGVNLLNPMSGLTAGVNIGMSLYRGQVEQAQAIGRKNAMEKDLMNTPRSMINNGSDICFSMLNGGRKIEFIRYGLTEDYLRRLGDYFAMYGYKQNKLMVVDIRNRYYYNYIKTIKANIKPIGRGIPKEHLQELINIYDRGVTVWHLDREGVKMFDYTYDNREIN